MKLYINGKRMDLSSDTVIAQTKEVNDVGDPSTRDANSTNTFKLPKTNNNLEILDFMTVSGNLSNLPYQKNECSVYSDTGECFIYKGWATIKDAGKFFDVFVIDGIVDFYKAIENTNLGDLDLSELTHQKTTAAIKATWSEDKPYRYILADYNGDTGLVNVPSGSNPNVNIDYLVPSVNVKWLWDKMFATYNATYAGGVFSTYDFTELWMSYPKGITITGDNDHTIFSSHDYTFDSPLSNSIWFAQWHSIETYELKSDFNQIHMQVAETATYRIKIKGFIAGFIGDHSQPRSSRIYLGKNAQGAANNNFLYISPFLNIDDNIPSETDFDYTSETFQLIENDTICILITGGSENNSPFNGLTEPENHIEVELVRVDPNELDFSDAFKDFNAKDFFKDILQRFALTMFKDKYTNDYTFLTLKELLSMANTTDWSDKFANKDSEEYIKGNYGQRNWLRYAYNDKEASHFDGYIDVANANLEASKDIIKSKIYAPERTERKYMGRLGKVYKLWEKQIVENPEEGQWPVEYTPLDKRYYFLRSERTEGNINIISKQLAGQSSTASVYYRENYYKLPYYDIKADYYAPLQQVLTRAIMMKVFLNLNDTDIVNIDFKKLYYFKQFSGYFLLNKVENYMPGRFTRCELIRVVFEAIANPPQSIKITKVVTNVFKATVTFEMAISVPYLTFEYRRTGSEEWQSIIVESTINPMEFTFQSLPFNYIIRLKQGSDQSNEVEISIPSNQTITP